MASLTTLEQLYTSAPILDYDDEPGTRPEDHEVLDAAGVMTMESDRFDAAILEALVSP
jgi:hypothetical protein